MKRLFLLTIAFSIYGCMGHHFEKDLRSSIQNLRDVSRDQKTLDFSTITPENDWSYLLILRTRDSMPLRAENEFGALNKYFGFEIEDMKVHQMRFYLLSESKSPITSYQITSIPDSFEQIDIQKCQADTTRYGMIFERDEAIFDVEFNSTELGEGTAILNPNC